MTARQIEQLLRWGLIYRTPEGWALTGHGEAVRRRLLEEADA